MSGAPAHDLERALNEIGGRLGLRVEGFAVLTFLALNVASGGDSRRVEMLRLPPYDYNMARLIALQALCREIDCGRPARRLRQPARGDHAGAAALVGLALRRDGLPALRRGGRAAAWRLGRDALRRADRHGFRGRLPALRAHSPAGSGRAGHSLRAGRAGCANAGTGAA